MPELTLKEMLDQAKERVAQMTDDEYEAMVEAQKKSFVRGMTARCEHGVLDFEQCGKCREKYRAK